jgi:predicted acetyltransferase
MLNLALEKCKDMNIEKVLITCDKKILHQQKLLSIMAVFLKKKF